MILLKYRTCFQYFNSTLEQNSYCQRSKSDQNESFFAAVRWA